MEEVLEKLDEAEIKDDLEPKKEKKYFRILGITLWRIFAYFIIYSVIGYFIETLFGIARYRSSRK